MKRLLFPILLCLFAYSTSASTVDTVEIYSSAMHKAFKCVVIKPEKYKKEKLNFPTVYVLHGYQGWYSNWIIRVPQLTDYADTYNTIIVCPEGGYSSWYFDSPVDSSSKFETYIAKEVPDYIDSHYRTIKDRKARAITGLSMGGHGALFISFRHAATFGACGSISGGLELTNSPNKFEIEKQLGDPVKDASNWVNYSVIKVIEKRPSDSLAITIDCGIDDIFIKDNRAVHEKMLKLKIAHDYTERPGNHGWSYWRNGIEYQLLFFRKYFEKMGVYDLNKN
jgi:S-formylglutathione hydrolase FrmB